MAKRGKGAQELDYTEVFGSHWMVTDQYENGKFHEYVITLIFEETVFN